MKIEAKDELMMNPKDKAEAAARGAIASTPGTLESVTAAALVFATKENLIEALEAKQWAVFPSKGGTHVIAAPKGSPIEGGCPCCSGVDAARLDGEMLLTGDVLLRANSASWGYGPREERGFTFWYQGSRVELEEVSACMDYIPTPQEALQILEECAMQDEQLKVREAKKEALVEKGWEVAYAVNDDGPRGLMGVGGPGKRYGVRPSQEGIFFLMDLRSRRGVRYVARFLPTPDRAAELLAQYGIARKELQRYRGALPPPVPEDS